MRTYQTTGRNPISIVAVEIDGQTHIGVARCGDGQTFSEKLGFEIAENRCYKQPWSFVEGKMTIRHFESTCELIINHIHCQKQTILQNLRRIDY